jgi:hypothetical protein
MFEENNNRNWSKENYHLILICDETGIFDAYKTIKQHLASNGARFLSLIYAVPENYFNPLFEKEITILENRFSHHLCTYTLKIEPGKYEPIQPFIEAFINSNTCQKMQFAIYGKEEFSDYVFKVLGYLNINSLSVNSHIKQ